MGNGGPGSLIEHSTTTGRLGLGFLGLEGEVFGSSALLARDRVEDLFLGLRRQRVWAETARRTFNHLDFGVARNVGRSKIPAERQGTNWRVHTRAYARPPGEIPLRKHPRNPVFVDEERYPHFVRTGLLLFLLQSKLSHSLSLAALGGVSERIVLINFFVSSFTRGAT